MEKNVRQALSRALQSVNERFARVVLDPSADIDIVPAPFLKQSAIYCVEHFQPPAYTMFYVGFGPRNRAYLLTGGLDNYAKLAGADGVVIDSPELAAVYAITFLEVTRSMSDLFYVVKSIDDVKFRPNLEDEDEQAKANAIEKYRTVLQPARALSENGSYIVTAYAVREQTLERHRVTVTSKGEITDDISTIEHGLPLVYGH